MHFNRKVAWININSQCNLKCSWCYHQNSESGDISTSSFLDLMRILKHVGVERITLIGGEPTLHINLLYFINLLKDFRYLLVTNGLAFSDGDFLASCINNGLKNVSISLKGYSNESFIENTGLNHFQRCLICIKNIAGSPVNASFHFTFSRQALENIDYKELADFLYYAGIFTITISDTRPYLVENNLIKSCENTEILEEIYRDLTRRNISVYTRLNKPLCQYNIDFVNEIIINNKLISQCVLRKGGGLFFDANLNMVLCNGLSGIFIGKFNVHYCDGNSLLNHLNTMDSSSLFEKLGKCSTAACKGCKLWSFCGGSCVLHWM